MENLKVMVLNAQDLFLFMDKHNHESSSVMDLTEIKWQLMSSSLFSNKAKEKCQILANTILEANADIVMMTEVGGHESISNFAKFLLRDEYDSYSLPSNSDRGIDLGYLVKKSLGLEISIQSYISHPLPAPAYKFSRDVLQLTLKNNHGVLCILLLVHIKSKLNLSKTDFEGRTRRVLEIQGLLEIYEKLTKAYPDKPILIGGDMNGHAGEKDTEEEFKAIYQKTDLKDCAYLARVPEDERFSYIYFNRGGQRFVQQIDYLFISEKFTPLLVPEETYFPRYKNLEGQLMPIPQRMEQKNTLPSDHYPFLATLKLST